MRTSLKGAQEGTLEIVRPNYPPAPMQHEALRVPRPRFRSHGVTFLLLAADLTALALTFGLISRDSDLWVDVVFTIFVLAAFGQAGLYRSRLTFSILDDLPSLLARVLIAVGGTIVVAALLPVGQSPTVWAFVFGVLILVVARSTAYILIYFLRSQRIVRNRALIVGAGVVGTAIAESLKTKRRYGMQPVGFIDEDPLIDAAGRSAPVVGGYEDITYCVQRMHIDHIIIAFSSLPEDALIDVIREADRLDCEISNVPRLFEISATLPGNDEIDGIPLVRLRRSAFRSPLWPLKRAFDVLVSGTALLLLSPVFAVIAILNRIIDGPGVIFHQERVGLDDERIEILKFRSLRPASDEEAATTWNVKHDDRVSSFGKFLRRSSLDELPQLWNIFRGDMSLVGPRPERPHFVEEFEVRYDRYRHRHRVPTGLTGWAQIHGLRGDTSISERARYDNYYIENWSLWFDIKIILLTFVRVFKGSG